MIARLANKLPPSFTLLDGIYTAERGPYFDGRLRRSNILIASSDIFSADKVGGISGVLNYYFLFVSKNMADDNRSKFRSRGLTYQRGDKKIGGGAGIWPACGRKGPQNK